MVYLNWNGHAYDTRPPTLPGKKTELTEFKDTLGGINTGPTWQLAALFFLWLETLESCNVTHTDEKYFYISFHTAGLPIIHATTKKKSNYNTHTTKRKKFINKTAAVCFHLTRSSSGGYLLRRSHRCHMFIDLRYPCRVLSVRDSAAVLYYRVRYAVRSCEQGYEP